MSNLAKRDKMKKLVLLLFCVMLTVGCSSNDEGTPVNPVKFKLVIDGVELNIPTGDDPRPEIGISSGGVSKSGDLISVNVNHGNLSTTDSLFGLSLIFTTDGKLLSGRLGFNYSYTSLTYQNYVNFPSHYFQVDTFVLDEVNHKIKLNFTGNLYFDNKSLTSEVRNIHAEIDMEYADAVPSGAPYITVGGIEQYCRANFNATPWIARFESSNSSFTNEDAYKIETHLANAPTPGNFSFNEASTDNYVRFSKFNTQTLTYDYYNVSGQVGYTYREFHGGTSYSFIGTFSFTAVNPNNSADVIQVTDGQFRSYQRF